MKITHLYINILALCLLPLFISANTFVDSLKNVLQNRIPLDEHRVDLLNQLGYEYWIIDPNESELYGTQALELATLLEYQTGAAFAKRVIGVAHWARGNYDPALEHLFDAFNIYTTLNDTLGIANTQLNIGMVYGDQKDYEKAKSYFTKSINGFGLLGKDDRIATAYTKTGTIHAEQKNFEEAYQYFDKALKIHEQNEFVYGQAEVNNRLGILFTEKGDLDKALSYLFRSLEAGELRSDQHGLAANYSQIGRVYLMKKDFTQAETFLLRGKKLAEEISIKKTQKDIYENLKDLEIAKGNHQKALTYFDLFEEIKDSLFNEEMASQIANLQTQHALYSQKQKLKIREQEIQFLEEKDRNNKFLLLTSVLGLVLLSIIAFRMVKNQQFKNRIALLTEKKLRKSKEEQLANEQEKTKELAKELSQRNKELTAYTVNFIKKNELISDIRATLSSIRQSANNGQTRKQLDTLEHKLKNAFQIDEDWESFRHYFENVHEQFFPVMKSNHPDLSSNDLKLCVLSRLNLNSKEMATMLGISPESVKTARYRLRKKLGLERHDSILDYLINLENKAGLS